METVGRNARKLVALKQSTALWFLLEPGLNKWLLRPFLADTVGFSCHLAATLGLPFLVQKPGVLGQPSPQRGRNPLLG